jgi:hypothetical protein
VSSPNEPGYPRTGENPGNGAPKRDAPAGHTAESGEVPPWQRGRARTSAQQRPPAEGQQPAVPSAGQNSGQGAGQNAGGQNADARLNRFMSGGGAETKEARPETRPPAQQPAQPQPAGRAERGDSTRVETAYASELPDLSGPKPRPPQRKSGSERPSGEQPARPAVTAGRAPSGGRSRGPVRASMQIRRVDPWSALKVSLLLSVVLFFVWMIAVAFLYLVLGGMGVWSKLNSNVGDLLTSASGSTGGELVSSGTIFGGAALIGLVNIVLLTAFATVGAFIYNLTTDLVGGIEVTLADRD